MATATTSTISAPTIEATNLYKFFHAGGEETLALRGVSLSANAGEIVAITGPSGSGKSTLLSCLAGLDEPDGGMVRVAGHELSRQPEAERSCLRARHIGMLYQSNNLIDHLSVAANVAIAQKLAKSPHAASIPDLLVEVGLDHRSSARPSRLSGGESARAGLAVALANNPDVIVADEPTGELDSVTAELVLNLLRVRAEKGAAVLLVTHSPKVWAVADREIRLSDGVVIPAQGRS
jgi:putative ABC transport system ATP-binding protein